jgi:hypothetical protein
MCLLHSCICARAHVCTCPLRTRGIPVILIFVLVPARVIGNVDVDLTSAIFLLMSIQSAFVALGLEKPAIVFDVPNAFAVRATLLG